MGFDRFSGKTNKRQPPEGFHRTRGGRLLPIDPETGGVNDPEAIAKWRAKQDDPNQNRKWSDGTKSEYERQETMGKRRGKCKGKTIFDTDCPANASPSGSGYCSTHEQQGVKVGEVVNADTVKACRDCNRNPVDGEGEDNWCRECTERRKRRALDELNGRPYSSETLELDDILTPSEPLLAKPKPPETEAQKQARLAKEAKREEERMKKAMEREMEYRRKAKEPRPVSPLLKMLEEPE